MRRLGTMVVLGLAAMIWMAGPLELAAQQGPPPRRPGGPGGPGGPGTGVRPGGPGGGPGGPGGPAPALDTTSKPASLGQENPAPATPAGLEALGGRWFRRQSDGAYLYRDGQRFLDVFPRPVDSNSDGIPDLKVRHDSQCIILESQNLPDHPTAKFPNTGNPNSILPQRFVMRLPLEPRHSGNITPPPMGPCGVANNGVVFFNPFEMGGMNAAAGYNEVWLDACCGHPEQRGAYHYHKYPTCVKTPFKDDGKEHSPVIGFAWDGYPLYGPYASAGVMAKDLKGSEALDVCNGHFDAERGYHYHVTPGRFPYLIGGYAGVVETSNNRMLGRWGTGALANRAEEAERDWPGIAAITPGTVRRDAAHTIRIELTTGAQVPPKAPSRVVLGPFEATQIRRQGQVITCEVSVPAQANAGVVHDVHLEFEGGGSSRTVLKKNHALRVVME